MQRSVLTIAVVVGMIAAWSIGRLQGQAQGEKVIFVSSSHASYTAMQPGNPAVTAAAIWGDANAGAHGTFSKFAPGYDAGMHTHTNDVWIVGVKGAYLYKDEAVTSCECPEDTNTGAAETRRRGPFFTKSLQASSI